MRSYQDEPVGAAPSCPAGAARSCLRTSEELSKPQHDPGSPQTLRGGHHLLWTQTQNNNSAGVYTSIHKDVIAKLAKMLVVDTHIYMLTIGMLSR